MAWTEPRTWVAGEVVTAAMMNEQIKDNLTYLKGHVDATSNVHGLASGVYVMGTKLAAGTRMEYLSINATLTGTSQAVEATGTWTNAFSNLSAITCGTMVSNVTAYQLGRNILYIKSASATSVTIVAAATDGGWIGTMTGLILGFGT